MPLNAKYAWKHALAQVPSQVNQKPLYLVYFSKQLFMHISRVSISVLLIKLIMIDQKMFTLLIYWYSFLLPYISANKSYI